MKAVKKNDFVMVIAGKFKDKEGKISAVYPKVNRVSIEGLTQKKNMKPQGSFEGGIVDRPVRLHASNILVVCTACKKPSRMGVSIEGESRVRVCKRCGKAVA